MDEAQGEKTRSGGRSRRRARQDAPAGEEEVSQAKVDKAKVDKAKVDKAKVRQAKAVCALSGKRADCGVKVASISPL